MAIRIIFSIAPDTFAGKVQEGSNLIYTPEIWAVHLAVLLEHYPSCGGPEVVFFFDINAALAAFVRASSETFPARIAARKAWGLLDSKGVLPWFERVASLRNLADAPSRNMHEYKVVDFPDIPQ